MLPSRLESLLAAPVLTPGVIAAALAAAVFLGAAHALTPGHGKTIVAAYLVGSRGRVLDAVYLGIVVTVTHTASVFVLGLAALYASGRIAMERIFPVLSLASGVLVAGVGLWLLWRRTHTHVHHGHHHHDHPHPHEHRETRGGLLSLGISGGLVPCPEALVVLLLSLSLGKLGFGLLVLLAFSAGLAAVLIAIGVAMVLAAPAAGRIAGESKWIKALPVASAAVVTLLGVVLAAQAVRSLL